MAEPLHAAPPFRPYPGDAGALPAGDRPRWWRRAWARARHAGDACRARLARPARLLPGLAAMGCAIAGAVLLWGVGVALLVAVPFLLLLDAQTPRA